MRRTGVLLVLLLLGADARAGRHAHRASATAGGSAARQHEQALAAFTRTGDVDALLATLERIMTSSPKYPDAYRSAGRLLARLERWQAAEDAYRAYLRLAPDAPDAELIGREIKRIAGIIQIQQNPVAYRAVRYQALIADADAAAAAGRIDALPVIVRHAAELDARRWEVPAAAGAALARAGRLTAGCRLLGAAVARAPAEARPRLDAALRACRGEIAYRRLVDSGNRAMAAGDYARASRDLYRAFELRPRDADVALSAAQAASANGDWTQATKALQTVAGSGPPEAARDARELLAHAKQLHAMNSAALGPHDNVPAGPRFDDTYGTMLAKIDRAEQSAQRDADAAEQAAEERERKMEEMAREIENARRLAAQAENSYQQLQSQASQGGVAGAIAAAGAVGFKATAVAMQKKAERLQRQLAEMRGDDGGGGFASPGEAQIDINAAFQAAQRNNQQIQDTLDQARRNIEETVRRSQQLQQQRMYRQRR